MYENSSGYLKSIPRTLKVYSYRLSSSRLQQLKKQLFSGGQFEKSMNVWSIVINKIY